MKATEAKVGDLLVSSNGNAYILIKENLVLRLCSMGAGTKHFGECGPAEALTRSYTAVCNLKETDTTFWKSLVKPK